MQPALAAILNTVSENAHIIDDVSTGNHSLNATGQPEELVQTARCDWKNDTLQPEFNDLSTGADTSDRDSSTTGSVASSTLESSDFVQEQLIIKKRVVTTETSATGRVLSMRQDLLEITVDCGRLAEAVRVKGSQAAIEAARRAAVNEGRAAGGGCRSTGSQFSPMADEVCVTE